MAIQPIEERIRQPDTEIIKRAQEYAGGIAQRRSLAYLDETVRFLRLLFRRRDGLLEDYARQGGRVKNLYTYEVGMEDDTDAGKGIHH